MKTALRARNGFTMVEVMVVVLIVAMFAAIAYPRLADIGEMKLERSARRLAHTITYLYSQARAYNKVVRLYMDTTTGKYFPAMLNDNGEFEQTTFTLFRSGRTASGIVIARVATIFNGTFPGGNAYIHLMPEGFAEASLIVLEDEAGRTVSLHVDPLTGRVDVEKGISPMRYGEVAA